MPLSQAEKEGAAYSSHEAQPTEKDQATSTESYFQTMDSPQKAGSNCADSQTQNARDETEDKENVEILHAV